MQYRRAQVPGGTYFFTVVTGNRQPIFAREENIDLLRQAFQYVRHYHHADPGRSPGQKKFWEHLIRDEKDMSNHVDYIHYNPVKHGLVASPVQWTLSSIHRYIKDGFCSRDWGASEPFSWDPMVGNE